MLGCWAIALPGTQQIVMLYEVFIIQQNGPRMIVNEGKSANGNVMDK